MGVNAGSMNRRIQIQRFTRVPDGRGGFDEIWSDLGVLIAARRLDVSDKERRSGAGWDNLLVSRFVIRASAFASAIRRTDRLVHETIVYDIDGIKEVPPGKAFLEITATSEEPL